MRYYRLEKQTSGYNGKTLYGFNPDCDRPIPVPAWNGNYVKETDGRLELYIRGSHVKNDLVYLEVES